MHDKKSLKSTELGVISLLSFGALLAAMLFSVFLKTLDDTTADVRMRWRYYLKPDSRAAVNPEIALLSINFETMRQLGRFGAGQWISRKPFCDQLHFFELYLKPSVVSYDLIFPDDIGISGEGRVTESPESLTHIKKAIEDIENDPTDVADHYALFLANKLTAEQGVALLALSFASVMDKGSFETIIGSYFRGGWLEKEPVKIPVWSGEDIYGDDGTGDESCGKRIPYVNDIAIPEEDIHFPDELSRKAYDFPPNASLPDLVLLDYSYLGFLNGPRDDDNIVRRIPLVIGTKYYNDITRETKEIFVPTFSLLTCLLHLGVEIPVKPGSLEVHFGKEIIVRTPRRGEYHIPISMDGRLYLNYTAKYQDFTPHSFSYYAKAMSLSQERRDKIGFGCRKDFNGKAVIVCVDLPDRDVGRCPIDLNTSLGLVQLTAVNNILNRSFLKPISTVGYFLLMMALFVVFTAICYQQKNAKLGFVSALFGFLYVLAAYGGVHFDVVILPVVGPVLYVVFTSFLVLTYMFFTEEKAKRLIRGMFSTMVSDKVLAYLESDPHSFSLQGRNMDVTVFFSDVANFTSISERLPPAKLTELLNSYLTPVTNCILEHDGYVDKYVGDGVMAVWGTPNPDKEHAVKACRAALKQQRLIDEMSAGLFDKYGAEIKVRMGINSGIVIAGNMGSEKKLQYTVMGDVVNLASRLEPVNKDFGTKIIIGSSTRSLIRDQFEVRMLERIVVIGKKEIVPVFELLGEKGAVVAERMKDMNLYEKALMLFHERKWDDCISIINDHKLVDKDFASEYLLKRCRAYKDYPPPDSWCGEYVRATKE